jgi:hypothetical protein
VVKFDQNGDGILQMDEFVSVDKMRKQLDALIREEKGMELEESKRVQQADMVSWSVIQSFQCFSNIASLSRS